MKSLPHASLNYNLEKSEQPNQYIENARNPTYRADRVSGVLLLTLLRNFVATMTESELSSLNDEPNRPCQKIPDSGKRQGATVVVVVVVVVEVVVPVVVVVVVAAVAAVVVVVMLQFAN